MYLSNPDNCSVCVVGLGYVGLPLTIAIANCKKSLKTSNLIKREVVGYDTNPKRINDLNNYYDNTLEIKSEVLKNTKNLRFTSESHYLSEFDIYIIALPTPIDKNKNPDLSFLINASRTIGKALRKRSSKINPIIVFESTVYPGSTEDKLVPIIETESGIKHNELNSPKTFFSGYSPERINPGDKSNNIRNIVKLVSGCNKKVTNLLDEFYGSFIKAGTHKTSTIKVAETAKIIENTQRDINIALVNELAMICHKLNIDTLDVLEAASTKWNFHNYKPGLVGGHCISVDPYYLTYLSKKLGYTPQVVLAGRRINDGMSKWIVERIILEMVKRNITLEKSYILVLGITFKENCPDMRNSKVIEIINQLKEYGIGVKIVDPIANIETAKREYDVSVSREINPLNYSAVIVAVSHNEFIDYGLNFWQAIIDKNTVCFDIKGILPRELDAIRI
mgnify:CR=1 FL=1